MDIHMTSRHKPSHLPVLPSLRHAYHPRLMFSAVGSHFCFSIFLIHKKIREDCLNRRWPVTQPACKHRYRHQQNKKNVTFKERYENTWRWSTHSVNKGEEEHLETTKQLINPTTIVSCPPTTPLNTLIVLIVLTWTHTGMPSSDAPSTTRRTPRSKVKETFLVQK